MAIAYVNAGAVAAGTTSLAIPYPTSPTAGNLLVVAICSKYPTNGPAAIDGWTKCDSDSSGLTAGVDTGNTRSTIFYKESAGTESGNLSVTLTSCNTCVGRMFEYSKGAGTTWSIACVVGSRNAKVDPWTGANAVTATSNPGLTAGDMLIVAVAHNVNACTAVSQAVTASGITAWGTMAERQDSGTNNGDDCSLIVTEHPVTTGTATANPVYAQDPSTTVAGGVNFLRLRETVVVAVPTLTTSNCDLITATTARGNGNITNTGGANATRRGFCYMTGTSGDPTTANSVAYDDGDYGTGAYTKVITGLTASTDYRVRAYAVNSAGTGYGTTVQLTTIAQRTLAIASGAYAATGTAVVLKAARKLPIASGAYVLSGTAVSFKATRKLSIASGAYLLTGTPVGLTKGAALTHYTLPIASGVFSMTGTATSLKAARKLPVASGAYTLSGTATSLLAARKLPIASGAFTLTGTGTSLKAARRLPLSSGAYALTGTPVGLARGRTLSIASGVFAFTGTNLTLKAARKLPIASGAYILNGTAVVLQKETPLKHYTIPIQSGHYTLTGTKVALKIPMENIQIIMADNGQFLKKITPTFYVRL